MKLFYVLAISVFAAGSATAASRTRAPIHPQGFDYEQRVDANQISMAVTNVGSFAFDIALGAAGLEYRRGSGKTVVYAGGLWLGALVGGQPRGTIAENSQEYVPGDIGPDPFSPDFRVFKLLRH